MSGLPSLMWRRSLCMLDWTTMKRPKLSQLCFHVAGILNVLCCFWLVSRGYYFLSVLNAGMALWMLWTSHKAELRLAELDRQFLAELERIERDRRRPR
jgi:hypothetical protein